MSVESAINSVLTTLRSLSSFYQAQTSSLIAAADRATHDVTVPDADRIDFDVNRAAPSIPKVPRPPTLRDLPAPTLPDLDDLQAVAGIEDQFTARPPTIVRPTIAYPVVEVPEFTQKPPALPDAPEEPDAPDTTAGTAPALTVPTPIMVEPISGTPPELPRPTFAAAPDVDVADHYEAALALTGESLRDWVAAVDALHDAIAEQTAALASQLALALDGAAPGLPDAWETQSYQQAQQGAFVKRDAALDQLDAAPSPITGLPSGTRYYARLRAELETAQGLMQEAARVYADRSKREAQHRQWAMKLSAALLDGALSLQAQAVAASVEAVLIAVQVAQAALDAALKVLEFRKRQLALLVRYNEGQVQRTEDLVKLEKTKLERLDFEIANNKLIGVYNEHQAKVYQTAIGYVEARVKLYNAQLEYLQVDIDWRKLDFQRFEAEVLAFQANVRGRQAEYAALRARIKGDLALADAEMGKVKAYALEVEAQGVNVEVKAVGAKARAARMKQVLEAYDAELTAKLSWLQSLDRTVDVAVRAIVKESEVEVAEQSLRLADQKLKDQASLQAATAEMEDTRLELVFQLQNLAVELDRRKAQGLTMASGAKTLGSISAAAYSGLNAIGSRAAIEEA